MASSALEENAAELSLLDALTQLEAAALQTHVDGVPSLLGKDLLRTWDLSPEELTYLLAVVHTLEEFYKNGRNLVVFTSGLAVSIFRDKSTRTRYSFAAAANLLGLTVTELEENKSQISHGETVRETANMISFLTDVIGIRDDLFINHSHQAIQQVVDAVVLGYQEKILHQRPIVINLQSDIDHPTQSLADLRHLLLHFDGLENLKGKIVAVTWAFSPSYGKPMSVPQGTVALLSRFGMHIRLAHPPGYELLPDIVEMARANCTASGGSLAVMNDMETAFKGAHVVYPKSWAPTCILKKRVELLENGTSTDHNMMCLEQQCIEMNSNHLSWECNEEMMKLTSGGGSNCLYMHCLPADISGPSYRKHGEVSSDVFNDYWKPLYREASHKPFVIASHILASCFEDVPTLLRSRMQQSRKG